MGITCRPGPLEKFAGSMRKHILSFVASVVVLACLGFLIFLWANIEPYKATSFLPLGASASDSEAPFVEARRKLPGKPNWATHPIGAVGVSSAETDSKSVATNPLRLIGKTLGAVSSRRLPPPRVSPDNTITKSISDGGDQQEQPIGSAPKAKPEQVKKPASSAAVQCDLSRPSCRRWLFLKNKKFQRVKALVVNEIRE